MSDGVLLGENGNMKLLACCLNCSEGVMKVEGGGAERRAD